MRDIRQPWWSAAHWLSLEAERAALHALVRGLLDIAKDAGELSEQAERLQSVVRETLEAHEQLNVIARTLVAAPPLPEVLEHLEVLKAKRLLLGDQCARGDADLRADPNVGARLVSLAAQGAFGLLGTVALNPAKYDGLPRPGDLADMETESNARLKRSMQ